MNTASTRAKLAAIVFICIAAAATAWAVSRPKGHALPAASAHTLSAATPDAVLAALPPATGTSLSDKEVTRWADAARRTPRDDRAWNNLGDALMEKARETANPAFYGYAESSYGQALAQNPKSVDALCGMAWVASDRHLFPKSVEWANKAIAVNPRSNTAYGLLGDADVELGHYDAAYAHYQKMLDIRPDTSSYSRGAHLLWLTGDSRKAMWLMAKAIKSGSPYAENTAWCSTQLALMLFSTGALLPADEVLQDALKGTPNNARVLAAMGKVKAARGDIPAAIDYYKKSLAVAPELTSLIALGDLYRLSGDMAKAEKTYADVENLHKKNTDISVHDHMQMAQFYADHDRNLVQALQFAEEHKLTTNVQEADTLAWCYYKNGLYAQAAEASTRALKRNTPDAAIYFHAGMIDLKMGNTASARKFLARALSLNAQFSPVFGPQAAAALKELGARPPDAAHVAAAPPQ